MHWGELVKSSSDVVVFAPATGAWSPKLRKSLGEDGYKVGPSKMKLGPTGISWGPLRWTEVRVHSSYLWSWWCECSREAKALCHKVKTPIPGPLVKDASNKEMGSIFVLTESVQSPALPFPSAPHMGRLIRKLGYTLLWLLWEVQII